MKIELTEKEAMLLDWVLTAHQFTKEHYDWLLQDGIQNIRLQAGYALLKDGGQLDLEEGDIRRLIVLVPVIFSIGGENVGLSLKKKLYNALLEERLKLEKIKEVYNAESRTDNQTKNSSASSS